MKSPLSAFLSRFKSRHDSTETSQATSAPPPDLVPYEDSKEALAELISQLFKKARLMLEQAETTAAIEQMVVYELERYGLNATFKDLYGFPHHISASVNEELQNHFPDQRQHQAGDVLSLSIGIRSPQHNLYQSWSFPIGQLSEQDEQFYQTARQTLNDAIQCIQPGTPLGYVSQLMGQQLEHAGYSAVRDFCGHSFAQGPLLHGDKQLLCYDAPEIDEETVFEVGEYYSVAIMCTAGGYQLKIKPDGFGAYTQDGSNALVFSHIVKITESGFQQLSDDYTRQDSV